MREDDHPERHREDQHRGLARARVEQREVGQRDEESDLQQAQQQRHAVARKRERLGARLDDREEEHRAQTDAHRREIEGMRVTERDLHDDPRVAPDEDQRSERRERNRSLGLHEAGGRGRETILKAGPSGDFQRRSSRGRLSIWAKTSASKPPSGEGAGLAIVPAAWSPKPALKRLWPGAGCASDPKCASAMRCFNPPRYWMRATISCPG